jgi:hypothetical protein
MTADPVTPNGQPWHQWLATHDVAAYESLLIYFDISPMRASKESGIRQKSGETPSDYYTRCHNAVQSWLQQINDKAARKIAAGDDDKIERVQELLDDSRHIPGMGADTGVIRYLRNRGLDPETLPDCTTACARWQRRAGWRRHRYGRQDHRPD